MNWAKKNEFVNKVKKYYCNKRDTCECCVTTFFGIFLFLWTKILYKIFLVFIFETANLTPKWIETIEITNKSLICDVCALILNLFRFVETNVLVENREKLKKETNKILRKLLGPFGRPN